MGTSVPRVKRSRPQPGTPMPSVANLGPAGYDAAWDDVRLGQECLHWNREGKPISLRQWTACVEDPLYRWVAWTDVDATHAIVTAWMGMDASWFPFDIDRSPHIFGTIELRNRRSEPSYHDEETDSSEADALATHNRRVSELKKELGI